MTVETLDRESIPEFIQLARGIHNQAWPDIPFELTPAIDAMLDHIESPTATVLVIREGKRKAMMMLDIAPLMASQTALIAVETAFGVTQPAPKGTFERMIEAAKDWTDRIGAVGLSINLGNRAGAKKLITLNGGQILHTAGYWRL